MVRAGASYEAKGWVVHINFNSAGAKTFGDLTTKVYQERSALAIVLDGKVISAPGVNDGPILGGSCEISGKFTEKQARNLATRGHGFDERVLTLNRRIAEDARLAAPYAEAFELERYGV